MMFGARTVGFSSSSRFSSVLLKRINRIKSCEIQLAAEADTTRSDVDLRSILNLDGTDLVEASFHDVLALQHELTALALEVFLLPDCDLKLAHLLHLLSVHGCSFYLWG